MDPAGRGIHRSRESHTSYAHQPRWKSLQRGKTKDSQRNSEELETDELEEGDGELSLHEFDLALGGLDDGASGALNGFDIAGDLLSGDGAKQDVSASTDSGETAKAAGTEETTTQEPTDEGSDGEADTDSATVETKEEN